MKGVIVNYRMGRHTQTDNQMVIHAKEVDTKEKAEKLVGKSVVWKSPAGKEIKGKITHVHGNKGNMRVLFERGMPGQSLGTHVEISA